MNSPYPPDYIKLPPTIACADVEDGVIVTMARVLGLCWTSRYRETSPLPPDRLAELVGRSRATLYRHLNRAQELGWLKVERRGRRLVLR
ncbi:MAG TPA: ArsR family transcriptional regulator, partial [Anaerolineae bacterium]|nr:ArsR family transcriptional regulator [Anaerolineae bacterium]